jgi:hypothetical protein
MFKALCHGCESQVGHERFATLKNDALVANFELGWLEILRLVHFVSPVLIVR